ncbi:MAG: nicotinate phosphoribosyltransferase [Candidatus Bipolaricaulaceae bacterium]
MKREFHMATPEEIKDLQVVDVYFPRSVEILKAAGIRRQVVAEVTASSFPDDYRWAVLAGVDELANLMAGADCRVHAMPEGTVFRLGEPVVRLEGEYTAFAEYETAMLGLLCQASGVATKAARCRLAAGDRQLISFGARRMHPGLAPMIDRSAYVGGCDGVAVVLSARLLGLEPVGTMPHALILTVGDPPVAFQLFHRYVPADVPRVCLVDTLYDEKTEAVRAAESLGQALAAVRLDTPSSRRGDMREILAEVRWELDARGRSDVGLFLSGGVDEQEILRTRDLVVGYGVGTSIASAPVINFALDIVEVDGKPFAKRGKRGGAKQVFRCLQCQTGRVQLVGQPAPACPQCGEEMPPLLVPLIDAGRLVGSLPPPEDIRARVLKQLARLTL